VELGFALSTGEVVRYAVQLRAALAARGISAAVLDELVEAATQLDLVIDAAAGSNAAADLSRATHRWTQARAAVTPQMPEVLLGPLGALPAIRALGGSAAEVARTGINGAFEVGPLRVTVASTTLVVQPPTLTDGTLPAPLTVGPLAVGQLQVVLASPFGGGLPGGGAAIRLPADAGYGGLLQVPLGAVQIDAAAVVKMNQGRVSILAILGASFLPPVQLSFGFSLDRVGGIVGVDRQLDLEALRLAVRTGTAGDVLLADQPPADPLVLITAVDRLFPPRAGSHLVGPSLRLSWLSFGPSGSLLTLDLAVVVELPSTRIAVLGIARASIPPLPSLLRLRLDVLGMIDPPAQLVSIDASLVDSHVLGVFEVFGDAALRVHWGSDAYALVSVGGFYPGYDPEPARVPALRRVGLALSLPVPIVSVRGEAYLAITSNSIQVGGRLEVVIRLGLVARGYLEVDAIVQFRPFRFEARVAAGFEVSAGGFSFASVRLEGAVSGPGPVVIRGSLRIKLFLFSLSWNQTITLGSGPADVLTAQPRLLDVLAEEVKRPSNVQAASVSDPNVVLRPRPGREDFAAVPPTGSLRVTQRRTPIGVTIDRVDGRPLNSPQAVRFVTDGPNVTERFAPGTYISLTDAEALNRPAFDVLPAGRVLSLPDPAPGAFPNVEDTRTVTQIVIRDKQVGPAHLGGRRDLTSLETLTLAARQPPALSESAPLVRAAPERWTVTPSRTIAASATAAFQNARHGGGVALAQVDADEPISLAEVR
jgi:hypothetical protein